MDLQSDFLGYLLSLETYMGSGEGSLETRDFVLLVYHLRKVADLQEDLEDNSTRKTREELTGKCRGRNHSPLSLDFKIRMKLMDLGRLSTLIQTESDLKVRINELC